MVLKDRLISILLFSQYVVLSFVTKQAMLSNKTKYFSVFNEKFPRLSENLLDNCSNESLQIEVELMTDFEPDRLSWAIKRKSNDEITAEAIALSGFFVLHKRTLCLENDNYIFTVFDNYGWGLNKYDDYGVYNEAYYKVNVNGILVREVHAYSQFEVQETNICAMSNDSLFNLKIQFYVMYSTFSWNITRLNEEFDILYRGQSFDGEGFRLDENSICDLATGFYELTINGGNANEWFQVLNGNNVVVEGIGIYMEKQKLQFGLCVNDADCDDGDPCTGDSCDLVNNLCKNEILPCSTCVVNYNSCEQLQFCIPSNCSECGFVKVEVHVIRDFFDGFPFWTLWSLSNNQTILNKDVPSDHQVFSKHCIPKDSYSFSYNIDLGISSGYVEFIVNDVSFHKEIGNYYDVVTQFESVICTRDSDCSSISGSCYGCNNITMQCVPVFSDECRSFGKPKALVILVSSSNSHSTVAPQEIVDYVFDSDNFSMRSQFSDCSFKKFEVLPFAGITSSGIQITNGVVQVSIGHVPPNEQAGLVAEEVILAAANLLGDLQSQFDFVITCLPPGSLIGLSSNWKAYAFVNFHLSIYNDKNCIYPSVLMHELGHNVGLGHSHDVKNYGDESGLMGISYSSTVGPRKCFNAPKSFELGWYHDSHAIYDALDLSDSKGMFQSRFKLVGLQNYDRRQKRYTILKIVNSADGFDYYFIFNYKYGMNFDTKEGIDEVLVTRQVAGNIYEDSELIAAIPHQDSIVLDGIFHNPASSSVKVYAWYADNHMYDFPIMEINFYRNVKICQADNDCDDSNSCTIDVCSQDPQFITEIGATCTHMPLPCSQCGSMLTVEVTTNDHPEFLGWNIRNSDTDEVIRGSTQFHTPNSYHKNDFCLEYGSYIFSIFYSDNRTDIGYTDFVFYSEGELMDNGTIYQDDYIESFFVLCQLDADCKDYDGCSLVDQCNATTNLCDNIYSETDEDCISCSWLALNISTDNFPEETLWEISVAENGDKVLFGSPYPFEVDVAYGRRQKPTRSGRRSKPTRAGRRSKPTRAGRRSKPTRAGRRHTPILAGRKLLSGSFSEDNEESTRVMFDTFNDTDFDILEKMCLEFGYTYHFVIKDTFGDGICCTEGNGIYFLSIDETVLQTGGDFTVSEDLMFKLANCSNAQSCDDEDLCTTDFCHSSLAICIYEKKPCYLCGAIASIDVFTDAEPEETSWVILKSDEKVLFSDKYSESGSMYVDSKCLSYGTYDFFFQDSRGNGLLNCYVPFCGYSFIINNTTISETDSSRPFSEFKHKFGICTSNDHCQDDDLCTHDYCDTQTGLCIFEQLSCGDCGKSHLLLEVVTNDEPTQLSWTIFDKNTNEEVLFHQYWVGDKYQSFQHSLCLTDGAYNFSIRSGTHEGIYCYGQNLNCGYTLTLNNFTFLNGDGYFEDIRSHDFKIPLTPQCSQDSDCNVENACKTYSCDVYTFRCVYEDKPCSDCGALLSFEITPDSMAFENFWSLTNNGKEIRSGGPYKTSYKTYGFQQCLPYGSYRFTMNDLGDDGFTFCYYSYISCGYALYLDSEYLNTSSIFFTKETNKFGICLNDDHCIDSSACSVGTCNVTTNRCNYEEMPCSFCGKDHVEIDVLTDYNPDQTRWEIIDLETNEKRIGGPYSADHHHYRSAMCLSKGDYLFTIYDTVQYNVNRKRAIVGIPHIDFQQPISDGMLDCAIEKGCGFKVRRNGVVKVEDFGNFSVSKTYKIEPIDEWILEFDEAILSGTHNSTFEEIILQYNIGKGKLEEQLKSSIMDKSCSSIVEDDSIMLKKSITTLGSLSIDQAMILIQISPANLERSELWNTTMETNGAVCFCVKTELLLLDSDISVTFIKTEIAVNYNFDVGFSGLSIGLQEDGATKVEEETKFRVSACLCEDNDQGIFNCLGMAEELNQNEIFRICVTSEDNSMEISNFENLILYQDGIVKFIAIQHGIPNSLTTVTLSSIAIAKLRLISDFFKEANPLPITIKGEVMLAFNDVRLLEGRKITKANDPISHASFELKIPVSSKCSILTKNKLSILALMGIFVGGISVYVWGHRDGKHLYERV